jgi:hypothetical protein
MPIRTLELAMRPGSCIRADGFKRQAFMDEGTSWNSRTGRSELEQDTVPALAPAPAPALASSGQWLVIIGQELGARRIKIKAER